MKNIWIATTFSSIVLFSCGGSEEGTAAETPKKDVIANLTNTSWVKECFPYKKSSTDDSIVLWNVNIRLSIDSSLKSTYKKEYFRPTDTSCDSMLFDALVVSKFEITGKVISEEGIEVYALNESFIYNSESSGSPPNYTLIYINSEKLYFGQDIGSNLGETPETRHSSISLNNYFSQIIN